MMGVASRPRRDVALIAVTVVVVALGFLVAVSPWATEDPGYSLDGYNASVWGLGARAAADDPFTSRLGGVQPDGDRYANHPPLTVWSAALGDWLSGGRSWAVRAPAVLASVLALAVLALLLSDAGLRAGAVAAGVVVAGTTGMFLTYGAMLDTPVVSLPFGLLALVVAQRAWQGRPPPVPALMAAGALAALSGWQAALAATLAAGACALAATEPPHLARRAAISLGAGVAMGTGLTLAWIGWVHTSVGPLFDQAGFRVNGDSTEVAWTTAVADHLRDLYGPSPLLVLLAVAVPAAFVLARPTRALATSRPSDPTGPAELDAPPVTATTIGVADAGPTTSDTPAVTGAPADGPPPDAAPVAAGPDTDPSDDAPVRGAPDTNASDAVSADGSPTTDLRTADPPTVGILDAVPTTSDAPPVAGAPVDGLPAIDASDVDPGGRSADALPSDATVGTDRSAWWRPRGVRPVLLVLAVTVLAYTLVFRNGAAVHDYWTYWSIALVGVAAAAVAQAVLEAGARTGVLGRRVAGAAVALAVLGLAAHGHAHQTRAETLIRDGLTLLPILDHVPDAAVPTRSVVAVYGAPGELPWADIATRGRAIRAEDLDDLRALPPDLPVLVVLHDPPSARLRARATASNELFVLIRADELVDHLDG